MQEEIVLAASFGGTPASPISGENVTHIDGDSSSRALSASRTERAMLMVLGGLLAGLLILSLTFVALVTYESARSSRAGVQAAAAPLS